MPRLAGGEQHCFSYLSAGFFCLLDARRLPMAVKGASYMVKKAMPSRIEKEATNCQGNP